MKNIKKYIFSLLTISILFSSFISLFSAPKKSKYKKTIKKKNIQEPKPAATTEKKSSIDTLKDLPLNTLKKTTDLGQGAIDELVNNDVIQKTVLLTALSPNSNISDSFIVTLISMFEDKIENFNKTNNQSDEKAKKQKKEFMEQMSLAHAYLSLNKDKFNINDKLLAVLEKTAKGQISNKDDIAIALAELKMIREKKSIKKDIEKENVSIQKKKIELQLILENFLVNITRPIQSDKDIVLILKEIKQIMLKQLNEIKNKFTKWQLNLTSKQKKLEKKLTHSDNDNKKSTKEEDSEGE